jgi:hypothetical protein
MISRPPKIIQPTFGVYAIGDIDHRKLKLILATNEAALMCQSAFGNMFIPNKTILQHTTVYGVNAL